jgi:ATP-dependent Clp protease ATP-binding subunit ClpA
MNRIDEVIVFRTLTHDHLEKILDIELSRVQQRIIDATEGRQFVSCCTAAARDFLLREGTDMKFGARHLKRSIERRLVSPMSNLLATRQIDFGNLITVDFDSVAGRLIFLKEDHGALAGREEEEHTKETAYMRAAVRAAGASLAQARCSG